MCFHGAFTKKKDARTKQEKTPGAFVKGVLFAPGDYRYLVLTRKEENPMRTRTKKKAARRRTLKKAISYVLGSAIRSKKTNPRRQPARRRLAARKPSARYAIVRGTKKNPSAIIAGLTAGAAQQAVAALASHFGKGHKIRKVKMR
ncbi:MAG TPA: hypothetical protein VFB79_15880 [Candidatus Angelobacter sp.]|nr:hypothetical protein [Candidatus Angelobacter sp.]